MRVIGVTGGIGTGKSTVANMFRRLGAVVLDADVIARALMEPKRLAWRQIVRRFGREILHEDQTINRARLAALVFGDVKYRKQLERIIHPKVLREIAQTLRRLKRGTRRHVVVLDVPLLLEVGAHRLVDAVVVVTVSPAIQRQRLRKKYGWSKQESTRRRAAQWTLSAKAALADYVIDNAGSVHATRTQVKRIWNQLVSRPSKRSLISPR